VKFWTGKFVAALVVVAVFLLDAWWLGPDPSTGEPRHILPYMNTGVASFVFLLVLLFTLSHTGGWVLSKFRRAGSGEAEGAKAQGQKRKRG